MRLSEELARIAAAGRRRRRPTQRAPQEIVPADEAGTPRPSHDPFDAARERLRAAIPPREED